MSHPCEKNRKRMSNRREKMKRCASCIYNPRWKSSVYERPNGQKDALRLSLYEQPDLIYFQNAHISILFSSFPHLRFL